MKLSLTTTAIIAALALATPALAQDSMDHSKMDHSKMNATTMEHSKMEHGDHDHAAEVAKAANDMQAGHAMAKTGLTLTRTDAIDAAIAAGGEPVVVKVLGVVCDFCATAMNKTFGKRKDVAATYVDLDAKTLNLVLKPGAELDDKTLTKLIKRSGYKADTILRGDALTG